MLSDNRANLIGLSLTVTREYLNAIRRHPGAALIVAFISVAVLGESIWAGRLRQGVAYLIAVLLGAFVTDLIVTSRRVHPSKLPVRRPLLEYMIALGCCLVGVLYLVLHFTRQSDAGSRHLTILWRLVGTLFVLNVPILLFYWLGMKYRWRELGFRYGDLRPVIPVMLVFAAAAYTSHSGTTLGRFIREEGSLFQGLVGSFLIAALPEEFFRMTWQTRLGGALSNQAAAWIITATMWSMIHVPSFQSDTNWTIAFFTAFGMIPLGLLWGYILFRTQSLLPTLLLHATNFWGLQNF
jgi:Type II CAAX prenyl endopeptidase Rce1-like